MPTAAEFAAAYAKATRESSKEPLFQEISKALKSRTKGEADFISIVLNTKLRGSDSRVVEDAVRIAFGDDLNRSRYPDAKFGEIPVEVKHTTSGFGKLPTDTYGLTETDGKWYLFVKGSIDRKKRENMGAWLMRSDHLYRCINEINPIDKDAIIPGSENAVEQIEAQIDLIQASLANAINRRAQGLSRDVGTMSLPNKVGPNRIRFDIKFESLLRSVISGVLND